MQNPSIKTENGNIVFSVPGAGQHVTVTSGTNTFNIDELPATVASNFAVASERVGLLEARLDAMESMDTELSNAIDTLDDTKADLSRQNTLVNTQREIIANMTIARAGREAMAARMAKIERQNRHAGVNLLDAADLNDVANSWTSLDPSHAEYDAFVDGLPIRVTTSRENEGTSCYPGWGRTNIVEVDHRKTYEFSVWVKGDVHASSMANYFGFFLYDAAGTRLVNSEPVTSGRSYSNPYFTGSREASAAWHKEVGYLIGTDMITLIGATTIGSVERSSMFFLMHPTAAKAVLRFGSCYSDGGANDKTAYTLPSIRELDMDRGRLGASLGNLDSSGGGNANGVQIHSNLVRHADFLNTSQGPSQVPRYGGDRWVRPLSPANLKFTVFDELGVTLPIIASVSRESGTGGCYGGWGQTNYVKIVDNRHYEFSIW